MAREQQPHTAVIGAGIVGACAALELLRAAYHLGNRHVALEVRPAELRLLDDPVLKDLLRARGLRLERCLEPFAPEGGAYGDGHDHGHGHSHDQGHDHSHPAAPHPA
jgi:urease accessory protein